jgi:hypothetical protein
VVRGQIAEMKTQAEDSYLRNLTSNL